MSFLLEIAASDGDYGIKSTSGNLLASNSQVICILVQCQKILFGSLNVTSAQIDALVKSTKIVLFAIFFVCKCISESDLFLPQLSNTI